MTRFLATGLVGLALLLAGCGQAPGAKGLSALALSQFAGLKPDASASRPPLDGSRLVVTMVAAKIRFPMAPVERDGDVTVWQAQDGTQLATRNGMMIWTRGFGMDLMSADTPAASAVSSAGSAHGRTYHRLDGANTPIRWTLSCTVSRGTKDDTENGLRHMVERCTDDSLTLENEYLFDSRGRMAKSFQWLSPMVGYLLIELENN